MELEARRKKEEEDLFKDPLHIGSGPSSEEVQKLREMVKKLQQKYNSAQQELSDLTKEANEHKNELLFLLKEHESDLKFSNGILQ